MTTINKQLKALQQHPRYQVPDAGMEKNWGRIAEAIGPSARHDVGLLETLPSYGLWVMNQYVSRTVMAGAFSVLIIASGWLTTVRAASSLPGETLYSVKMLTERAQLRLASLDRRAVLHTEFAGRRIEEAAELQTAKPELVKETLQASREQIASAQQDLEALQAVGDDQALTAATTVQKSLDTLDATLDGVVADSTTPEATDDALATKEVAHAASETVTDVVVGAHEEQQTATTEREITELFKKTLGDVETRQRFDLQRLAVIQTALADDTVSYDGFVIPTNNELLEYEGNLTDIEDTLTDIMNDFAAGGYRSAFDALQDIDASLLAIDGDLAQIEITIMTARSQMPVVEEPVTEPCTENCSPDSEEPTTTEPGM